MLACQLTSVLVQVSSIRVIDSKRPILSLFSTEGPPAVTGKGWGSILGFGGMSSIYVT